MHTQMPIMCYRVGIEVVLYGRSCLLTLMLLKLCYYKNNDSYKYFNNSKTLLQLQNFRGVHYFRKMCFLYQQKAIS